MFLVLTSLNSINLIFYLIFHDDFIKPDKNLFLLQAFDTENASIELRLTQIPH